jgi:hypothetical protein
MLNSLSHSADFPGLSAARAFLHIAANNHVRVGKAAGKPAAPGRCLSNACRAADPQLQHILYKHLLCRLNDRAKSLCQNSLPSEAYELVDSYFLETAMN